MNTTSLPVLDSNTKHVVAAAMNLTTTARNLTTPICTLSPHARALNSVLTGFVSTVLTGISGGFQVAFQVAWVCWFAALRKPPHSLSTKPTACAASKCPRAASHFFTFMDRLVRRHDLRDWSSDFFRGDVDEEVGLLGGWRGCFTTMMYSPVIQVMLAGRKPAPSFDGSESGAGNRRGSRRSAFRIIRHSRSLR
jgi:hypothetical protein